MLTSGFQENSLLTGAPPRSLCHFQSRQMGVEVSHCPAHRHMLVSPEQQGLVLQTNGHGRFHVSQL